MPASATTVSSKSLLGTMKWSSFSGLVSPRYFFLRSTTAGGTVFAGLIQTFVFARVLSPELFSIFILVGTLGLSLWLFDLGISKILYVKLRARHLAADADDKTAGQANAVVAFYALLVMCGSLLCFAVMAGRPAMTKLEAAEFALFFLFSALNLVWFALRNISAAVDQYIYFETLEAVRRVGHIAGTLALLAGLPFLAFLTVVNLLWGLLFALCIARLVRVGALLPRISGVVGRLWVFLRENRRAALRTGSFAACDLYIYNFLYLIVPVTFGLGAPTIILDTTFKVFFGALIIYAACCDLLVPRQTRAFAEHDAPTLMRATLAAAALCAVPAIVICTLLMFGAERLFALLLGSAVIMPPATTPVLVVLIVTGLCQMVANFLLTHTGYFKEMSRLAAGIAVALTAAILLASAAGAGIVGMLQIYAVVYACGAAVYILLAFRGPITAARRAKAAPC